MNFGQFYGNLRESQLRELFSQTQDCSFLMKRLLHLMQRVKISCKRQLNGNFFFFFFKFISYIVSKKNFFLKIFLFTQAFTRKNCSCNCSQNVYYSKSKKGRSSSRWNYCRASINLVTNRQQILDFFWGGSLILVDLMWFLVHLGKSRGSISK